MIVGSDGASLLDDFLNNLNGRLEILVELKLGVLNEGTIGVLGDDATDSCPEDSLEYFIREEVRRTPVVANAAYEGVELNVDTNNSVVCSLLNEGFEILA